MTDSIQLIPNKQITRGTKLGEGGFGIVYKGFWLKKQVAIKTLRLQQLNQELQEEFYKEARVMAKLKHATVIQLYGICNEPGHYAMLMEFMPRGDLYQLLSNQQQTLPWKQRWQLAIDIGSGLSYLHTNRVLHRDLKSMNILLTENLRAKITDFGLSKLKMRSSTVFTSKAGGSIPWMAPELFGRNIPISSSSDVYAYGMVLWEIAARKIPFSDAINVDQIAIWVREGEREDIPKDCPSSYASVIQACWKQAPRERPSSKQALATLQHAQPTTPSKPHQPPVSKQTKLKPKTPQIEYDFFRHTSLTFGVWNCRQTLYGHNSSVIGLAPLADGNIASCARIDWRIGITDIKKIKTIATLAPSNRWRTTALTQLSDQRLASGLAVGGIAMERVTDTAIKIWDIRHRKCVTTCKGHLDKITSLAPLSGSLFASGSKDTTVKIWNYKKWSNKCLSTLKGHRRTVYALAQLSKNRLASAGASEWGLHSIHREEENGKITIWDVNNSQCVQTLPANVNVFALSSLSEHLVANASNDTTVKIGDIRSGKTIKVFRGHESIVRALAPLSERYIASGSDDHTIKIWDLATEKCVKTLYDHDRAVVSLARLTDGRLISGGEGGRMKIWGEW